MSDVLAVLERQRQGIQALRDEKVRNQERQRLLATQIEEAEGQLRQMGVTSMEQVEALDREAGRLAEQIERGLSQVKTQLEGINGQGTAGGGL